MTTPKARVRLHQSVDPTLTSATECRLTRRASPWDAQRRLASGFSEPTSDLAKRLSGRALDPTEHTNTMFRSPSWFRRLPANLLHSVYDEAK